MGALEDPGEDHHTPHQQLWQPGGQSEKSRLSAVTPVVNNGRFALARFPFPIVSIH